MFGLILLFLILRMMRGMFFWTRPWGFWGMGPMWRRPPMGGFGPGLFFGRGPGMSRFGRF